MEKSVAAFCMSFPRIQITYRSIQTEAHVPAYEFYKDDWKG